MTAVDLDALDKLRGALAYTLAGTSVRVDFAGLLTNMEARRIAEILAPVVQALVAEGAAAELRAAANDWKADVYPDEDAVDYSDKWLRDRAAELDPK